MLVFSVVDGAGEAVVGVVLGAAEVVVLRLEGSTVGRLVLGRTVGSSGSTAPVSDKKFLFNYLYVLDFKKKFAHF